MFFPRHHHLVRLTASVAFWLCVFTCDAARQVGPFEALEDVMFLMEREYYDPTFGGRPFLKEAERLRVKFAQTGMPPKRAYPAIQRLLRSLKASHLAFHPPPQYVMRAVLPKEEPTFRRGVARREDFRLHQIGDFWVVSWVRPDSPAASVGLHAGWIVERLDAHAPQFLGYPSGQSHSIRQSLRNWSRDAVDVRGLNSIGRPTKITVPLLPDESEAVRMGKTLERPRVTRQVIDNCWFIRFDLFLIPTVAEVVRLIERTPQNLHGLILDLRDNRGGIGALSLPVARAISNRSFELGYQSSRGGRIPYPVRPGEKPYLGPVVILINEGSYSTAEILARGLQAVGRARIIGTQTSGEALPSLIRTLRDGSTLQMPVGDFRDIHDRPLEGNGVTPDDIVPLSIQAFRNGVDPQIKAATAYLKEANPTPISEVQR